MRSLIQSIVILFAYQIVYLCHSKLIEKLKNSLHKKKKCHEMMAVEFIKLINGRMPLGCWFPNRTVDLEDIRLNSAKETVIRIARDNMYNKTLPMLDDVFVYIHAYQRPNSIQGLVVFTAIMEQIVMSGLNLRATRIQALLWGDFSNAKNALMSRYDFVHFIDMSKINGTYYELPTLAYLQYQSRYMHPDAKVLYLHTKSSSKSYADKRRYWLHYMLKFNILLHEQAIKLLSIGWDTYGIFFRHGTYATHYSGNH